MFLRFIVTKNKIRTDKRNLLSIEGIPNRYDNTFPAEYRQNFKAGKLLEWQNLSTDSTYCKVATTYYFSDEVIDKIIEILKSENFSYYLNNNSGFPKHIYWKRISETQFNETLASLYDKVKENVK